MPESPEPEPIVEISMTFRMAASDIPKIIGTLAAHSAEDFQIGQGKLDVIAEAERKELQEVVRLDSVRRFYNARFDDDRPKPVATRVFNTVARGAHDEEVERDKKGRVLSIKRTAWDRELRAIKQGQRQTSWKPGTESRRFADAFTNYLASFEKADQ